MENKCEHCNGKGYNTVMYGREGLEDFGGEGFIELPSIHNEPCKTCNGNGFIRITLQAMEERFDKLFVDAPGRSIFISNNECPTRIEERQGKIILDFIKSEQAKLLQAILENSYITHEEGDGENDELVVSVEHIKSVAKEWGIKI